MTRTRKLALAKSVFLQVRPQRPDELPRNRVDSVVESVAVDFGDVQFAPPFQESWTHSFGEAEVESTLASRRTSMPLIVASAGMGKL